MDVRTRMKTIRMIEKMEKNPIYNQKLGNKDTSIFLYYENTQQDKKGEREYEVRGY